jgi:hypothetical protein
MDLLQLHLKKTVSTAVNKISKILMVALIELLCFWTLFIGLFLFKTHKSLSSSETRSIESIDKGWMDSG